MYWYISFLRPPPVSIPAHANEVIITPQVANDLRTELRYDPTDIYYDWQRVHPAPGAGHSQSIEKLTTFTPPSSTYKPLPVPLPATRPGEKWRLGLFPSRAQQQSGRGGIALPELSDLLRDTPSVLGVWSEPIDVVGASTNSASGPTATASSSSLKETSGRKKAKLNHAAQAEGSVQNETKAKGKGKGKEKDEGPKQTRIRREWLIDAGADGDGEGGSEGNGRDLVLRIIEQTSFDLDKKIWDSGLALSAWLCGQIRDHRGSNQPKVVDSSIARLADQLRGEDRGVGDLNILEIGSGTGLVSIALALVFNHIVNSRAREMNITATDLGSAMELMDENIELNLLHKASPIPPEIESEPDADSSSVTGATVNAGILDWDNPLPSWVHDQLPSLIIAADVTYNTASFPSLVRTLEALLSLPSKPELLLAYKERDPAERELWTMLKDVGVEMALIAEVRGAEEVGKVEIYSGRLRGDA